MTSPPEGSRAACFSAALQRMLIARRMPASVAAVAAEVRRANLYLHAHTIRQALAGNRFPNAESREVLFKALGATAVERQEALGISILVGSERSSVPIAESLLADGLVDKGRASETVRYRYLMGEVREDDRVEEHRRTVAGSIGLEIARVGPGQLGDPSFDLRRLDQLRLSAKASVSGNRPRILDAQAFPASIEVHQANYEVYVFFGEVLRNEIVDWSVSYAWPGLWDSLRADRIDYGQVNLKAGGVEVKRLVIDVVIPASVSPAPVMFPRDDEIGTLTTSTSAGVTVLSWAVTQPPLHSRFGVSL